MTDTIESLRRERDEARAEVARLQERIATQDDGLRYGEKTCVDLMAQIEVLRGKLDALATAHERDLVTIWHEATEAIHPPGSAREVAEEVRSLRQERNIAHESIDRLRAERRQLRARLVECLPFVGVCPVDPNRIQLMHLVRDLAEDALEEVKPTEGGHMTVEPRWYAAGGGIARCGPFKSQREAYEAMLLTDAARQAQHKSTGKDMPYPHDVVVWPEYAGS